MYLVLQLSVDEGLHTTGFCTHVFILQGMRWATLIRYIYVMEHLLQTSLINSLVKLKTSLCSLFALSPAFTLTLQPLCWRI
jgi:hypothetical protein